MTFSLSLSSISDSVCALAAFEMLTATPDQRLLLAPLLDRGRAEPLLTIIRSSFAATVLELLPFVSDMAGMDDDGESGLLSLDIRLPASVPATLLRRQLERAVAMHVLESSLLATSPALAEKFASSRREAVSTIRSALTIPFVRKPYF